MENTQHARHAQHAQDTQPATGSPAATPRAWLGKLPERIRHEDMVEEKASTPHHPSRYAYDPEGSWKSFACLAADLGL
ncbi:hypothetical protein [Streptomyces flavofungini]|uniref:Uncharacterized protein n=1 Tax=Streptomyces flavofungini TaxID=68200 RepID=A0ABS0WXX7_9ACTN|nr:hypothetical protein [Streptomyces flavofungini]MBJ3805748.1 hypothetical protein [Streptomyces flavofungini]GHC71987.1 hypothetical protein GCM10010349_48630 [Streptomyces flavofungini]